ncbi:TRICHOME BIREFRINGENCE-LIKE 9 [Wolffia australiana]
MAESAVSRVPPSYPLCPTQFLAIAPIVLFPLVITLPRISPYFSSATVQRPSRAECDYSSGKWVAEGEIKPHSMEWYTEDCPFLDPGFRCRRNGRQDTRYLNWRWRPQACALPRFNANDLLERSKNGRIVFVGDSIGRNHWESLVCLLLTAVANQSAVYEENGNPITKHKGFLSLRFPDHNLTVEYYRTPFLVAVGRPPPSSPPTVKKAVRVDALHWQSRRWAGADLLVFNAGHWWSREKTLKLGCYFQEGATVNSSMDVREAFRRSLRTWGRWVREKVDLRRSFVFFRSFSPVHFSGGTWDKGGRCNMYTEPGAELGGGEASESRWVNGEIRKATERVGAKFLDITSMTEPRRDGHPSLHREAGAASPFPQDCSHWCLPGVPDAWNELLYAHLLLMDKR